MQKDQKSLMVRTLEGCQRRCSSISLHIRLARFLKITAPQVEPPASRSFSNARLCKSCLGHLQGLIPREKAKTKRKNDKKSKGKFEYLAPKAGIVKQKFQGTCYNCDQPGHRVANCKMPKRVMIPRSGDMVVLTTQTSVTMDRSMYMATLAHCDIKGEGDVLKMTREKLNVD
ncbi:retrotransposon protein, putative, ty1-copia subclass [Tanacetum coccineum]